MTEDSNPDFYGEISWWINPITSFVQSNNQTHKIDESVKSNVILKKLQLTSILPLCDDGRVSTLVTLSRKNYRNKKHMWFISRINDTGEIPDIIVFSF